MKFGEMLRSRRREGWRYVNYEELKSRIKANTDPKAPAGEGSAVWSRMFKTFLVAEISAVNSFFLGMESILKMQANKASASTPARRAELARLMADLCAYVVLNYLAVLKIVKKHDKYAARAPPLSEEIKTVLFTTDFFLSLQRSDLLVTMRNAMCALGTDGKDARVACASCRRPADVGSSTLPCGHRFCWACLAEITWTQGTRRCSVCGDAKVAATDPVDLQIRSIIGSSASHYSPFALFGSDGDKKEEAKTDGPPAAPETTQKDPEPPRTTRKQRRRPFGSIRCSKCNKFGLEGECCGQKYHVVIRVRRVPMHVRSELLKKAFETFAEAEKVRQKIEDMYPKRPVKMRRVRRSSSPSLMNATQTLPPLTFSTPSDDASTLPARVVAAGSHAQRQGLYADVVLAEARAHAAMTEATMNQSRCRSLEAKLASLQEQIHFLLDVFRVDPAAPALTADEGAVRPYAHPMLTVDGLPNALTSPSKRMLRSSPRKNTSTSLPEATAFLGTSPRKRTFSFASDVTSPAMPNFLALPLDAPPEFRLSDDRTTVNLDRHVAQLIDDHQHDSVSDSNQRARP